jgi:ABC-type nitrate/sulfonate/bicarbonate transport system substrate-binding protein
MAGDSSGQYTRRAFVGLAGVGLAGTALGCGAPAAAPAAPVPATGAPAPATLAPALAVPAAPAPLQYGTISKTAWDWPRYIALQKGFFERAGFQTDYILFRTPANGAQLLTAGGLDFAGINPETVIRSVNSGAPLAIIASDMNTAPYSLIARPEIRGFADFRGKIFPSSGPREQTTVWMKTIMKANGLQEDEYEFATVGGTAERMAALRSGAVAGGLIGQPQDFQLVADGFHRVGPLSDWIADHPLSVHAGRIDWLQANPEAAVAGLRALRDAVRWLYDPANKDEAVALLSQELEVEDPLARQTYDLLVLQIKLWNADLNITPAVVQKSLDFLVEIADLPAPPRPPSAISTGATSRQSTGAASTAWFPPAKGCQLCQRLPRRRVWQCLAESSRSPSRRSALAGRWVLLLPLLELAGGLQLIQELGVDELLGAGAAGARVAGVGKLVEDRLQAAQRRVGRPRVERGVLLVRLVEGVGIVELHEVPYRRAGLRAMGSVVVNAFGPGTDEVGDQLRLGGNARSRRHDAGMLVLESQVRDVGQLVEAGSACQRRQRRLNDRGVDGRGLQRSQPLAGLAHLEGL